MSVFCLFLFCKYDFDIFWIVRTCFVIIQFKRMSISYEICNEAFWLFKPLIRIRSHKQVHCWVLIALHLEIVTRGIFHYWSLLWQQCRISSDHASSWNKTYMFIFQYKVENLINHNIEIYISRLARYTCQCTLFL